MKVHKVSNILDPMYFYAYVVLFAFNKFKGYLKLHAELLRSILTHICTAVVAFINF
jgi:hypothetical protein